jgi:hypothetical protein
MWLSFQYTDKVYFPIILCAWRPYGGDIDKAVLSLYIYRPLEIINGGCFCRKDCDNCAGVPCEHQGVSCITLWRRCLVNRRTVVATNRITSVWLVRGQIVVLKVFRFDKSTLPGTSFLLFPNSSHFVVTAASGWIKRFTFLSCFNNCLVTVLLEKQNSRFGCHVIMLYVFRSSLVFFTLDLKIWFFNILTHREKQYPWLYLSKIPRIHHRLKYTDGKNIHFVHCILHGITGFRTNLRI